EQWKSSSHSRRRERTPEEEEGGTGEKRRKKGGKRRKKDKHSKSHYDNEEGEADMMNEPEMEDEDVDNYIEPQTMGNDDAEGNAQDLLAAAGLEDSDAEDDMAAPSSNIARRRQALSESDDDEPIMRQSSPIRENSADMELSDGEIREPKTNGDDGSD
ncbi:hypothetical protein S83_008415, partial [Arachis hypogaea]